jgi:hypothetical protein
VLSELVIAFVDPQVLEQLSFALEQFFDCFKQKRFTEPPGTGQKTTFGKIDHLVDIFGFVGVKNISLTDFPK